ncbi:MAG: hypothetical protein KR126chlam6_00871 [Candidatus Anoxychlamydiales bacterium]|nr:hypothetical protein [Candidatus Anoxychlamydiales bacterium]
MKFKIKYSLVLFFSLTSFIFQTNFFAAIENAEFPYIITNGLGQYTYDLWTKNDGTNDIIQVASSSDYGANWNTPIDLSAAGQNAKTPYFTNDSTEVNVFAIWVRSNGANDIIQFSSSLNYAQTWTSPQDLSATGQNASNPHMITNLIGNHVYAIWARSNSANDIIQFSRSLDYGQTFSNPVDLSATLQSAKMPQIATNINQNCICAIWARSNGTNDIIQYKHSQDYGANWNSTVDLSETGENARNPRIITNGTTICAIWARQDNEKYRAQFRKSTDNGSTFSDVIDLSPDMFSVNNPRIVTSNDAKYIYVSWYMFDGMFTDVHVVVSTDYGTIFTAPYVLNKYGENCKDTDITTDNSGKNTYVVWARSNGYNDIVQIGKSTDYGATWTTYGMDLSQVGQDAKNPRVMTNQSGKEVYVSWARFDGTKDVIQEVHSNDYGVTFSIPKTVSN